ncbi:MAG: hypothetical protein JWN46_3156 [Acidimicrobiales bacterium]|nr:hypothetical protein [Acidimicrobiales bacterium]
MPQDIAPFEWSDDALRLRQLVYEHWCEHGRGPNLRDVHEAIGLTRRQTVQAYRQLQLGICGCIDLFSQNASVYRFMPFASFPTQVKAYVDDTFHSFAGCAMETMPFSKMPPFADSTVTFESYCSCCLEPVRFTAKAGQFLSREPDGLLIHVSTSPWDWQLIDTMYQCDSMNFVIDADHAERYEREIGRRGVLFTLEQAMVFAGGSGDRRMWNFHAPPETSSPEKVINGARGLGVDVANWDA